MKFINKIIKGISVDLKLPSLERSDLINVLELLYDTTLIDSETKLIAFFDKLSKVLPFDAAVCALVDLNSDGTYKNCKKLINTNFPKEWLKHYIKNGLGSVDPFLSRAFLQYKSLKWSEITKNPILLGPATKKFIKSANDYGLEKGISHGARSANSPTGSYFTFSGSELELDVSYNQLLDYIAPFLHNILAKSLNNHDREKPNISKREMDVLLWLKEGKTNWEISCILQISESTVKYHLENIYAKLKVSTRSGAVASAISLGIIEI